MDAAKPAMSVVMPPPTASSRASLSAPVSSSHSSIFSTVAIFLLSSLASMAKVEASLAVVFAEHLDGRFPAEVRASAVVQS